MSAADALRLTLPNGVPSQSAAALARLVTEVTGQEDTIDALPWLAPALLFVDPRIQDRLSLPTTARDEALVQDYQAVHFDGGLPIDTALEAKATSNLRAASADYRFALATGDGTTCARMETALRLVPARDVGAAQPARFRAEALKDTLCGSSTVVTQDQVNAYLALSGDGNPIHRDADAAAALGLASPVVPGLLALSLIQPFCQRAAPVGRLQHLKARFLAPVCVGQGFRICVQDRGADRATGAQKLRAYLLATGDRATAICDLMMA